MSYEGYEQYLCQDGHYWEQDAYYENDTSCPIMGCGKPVAWCNAVDTTNDDGNPIDLKVERDAVFCVCPTCKHAHVVEAARYQFPPEGQGHRM
jgi:hypothetical protein